MIAAVTVASLALSLFAGVPTAAVPPPQGEVTIEKVKVNGTGCRHDTVATAISPDKRAFTVTYSEYIVSIVPGSKLELQKRCNLTVKLNVPAGMRYQISNTDFRGFRILQPSVVGKFGAEYSFQGNKDRVVASHTLMGPLDDDYWQLTHTPDPPTVGVCAKERKLDINTDLRLTPGSQPTTAVSQMGVDSADGQLRGKVTSEYALAWQKC